MKLSTRDCRGTLFRIEREREREREREGERERERERSYLSRFYSCNSYESVEKFAVLFGPDSPTSRSVPFQSAKFHCGRSRAFTDITFTDIFLQRSVPDSSYMVAHVHSHETTTSN